MATLLLLSGCARQDRDQANWAVISDELSCNLTYTMLVGPLTLETTADLTIGIERSLFGDHYIVRTLTVHEPWTGREELDPWLLFNPGESRPLAEERGSIIVLFSSHAGGRGFTINRATGDAGFVEAAPMGENEYFGGCVDTR